MTLSERRCVKCGCVIVRLPGEPEREVCFCCSHGIKLPLHPKQVQEGKR